METKRESTEAGKHRDMSIKTVQGQDNEGHLHGSNQSQFNEQRMQEVQQREDENELNKKDDREEAHGNL